MIVRHYNLTATWHITTCHHYVIRHTHTDTHRHITTCRHYVNTHTQTHTDTSQPVVTMLTHTQTHRHITTCHHYVNTHTDTHRHITTCHHYVIRHTDTQTHHNLSSLCYPSTAASYLRQWVHCWREPAVNKTTQQVENRQPTHTRQLVRDDQL